MYDRESLYPGRVKLRDVLTGEEKTYDLIMADEPIQEGTPPTTNNLLADDTAALWGLDKTGTVNLALKQIHGEMKTTAKRTLLNTYDVTKNQAVKIPFTFEQAKKNYVVTITHKDQPADDIGFYMNIVSSDNHEITNNVASIKAGSSLISTDNPTRIYLMIGSGMLLNIGFPYLDFRNKKVLRMSVFGARNEYNGGAFFADAVNTVYGYPDTLALYSFSGDCRVNLYLEGE